MVNTIFDKFICVISIKGEIMKKVKKICLSIFILMVLMGLGVYQRMHYSAENVIITSNMVETEYGWVVEPEQFTQEYAVVFYQGAGVDSKAYLPLAEKIAQQGYTVHLMDAPFDIALFATKQTEKYFQTQTSQNIIVMGHSLGGVFASRVALENHVSGLVLLSSYPDSKTDLAEQSIEVLSIKPTQDYVLNQQAWQSALERLPEHTTVIEILGGNHAQFGQYGEQRGDGVSTITSQQQQQEVVLALEQMIQRISLKYE